MIRIKKMEDGNTFVLPPKPKNVALFALWLEIFFIGLKLIGFTDSSWLWVFYPLLIVWTVYWITVVITFTISMTMASIKMVERRTKPNE